MRVISKSFKYFLFISIFSLSFFVTNNDRQDSIAIERINLENQSLYFVLRGSETKMGGYARQYNRYDSKASHIALGIFSDSIILYHVNTGKKEAFIKENLSDFIFSEKEEYDYLAIWKVKGVTASDLRTIKERIDHLDSINIRFDYKFDLQNDNKLYCSEFVYKALLGITPNLFENSIYTKEVPMDHRFFLKKDTITYIPLDFFVRQKRLVELIFEWKK